MCELRFNVLSVGCDNCYETVSYDVISAKIDLFYRPVCNYQQTHINIFMSWCQTEPSILQSPSLCHNSYNLMSTIVRVTFHAIDPENAPFYNKVCLGIHRLSTTNFHVLLGFTETSTQQIYINVFIFLNKTIRATVSRKYKI